MRTSSASGSMASAAASSPGSTMVMPARSWTSSRAAVRVAGDGNADAQPAIRGRAPQLGGNRLRIAEEARQSSKIENDFARAICSMRGEKSRATSRSIKRTSFRSIQSGKHATQHARGAKLECALPSIVRQWRMTELRRRRGAAARRCARRCRRQ